MSRLPTYSLIAVLALIAAGLGWNYYARPFERYFSQQLAHLKASPVPAPSPTTVPVTINQQIAGIMAWPVDLDAEPASFSAELQTIALMKPGYVTLFGTSVTAAQAQAAIHQLDTQAAAPWVWVDHEGGTVQRLSGEGFSKVPSWSELCQQSATQSGEAITTAARELKAVGVDGVLGPVLDLRSGSRVLGTRLCSDQPDVVLTRSLAVIAAWQAADVQPVIKHFPGIGAASRDLHTNFARVEVNPAEAGVFAQILDKFPKLAVMVSHVGVTNQYPDIPCSQSDACVQELAANFPSALIVTDALEMVSAGYNGQDKPPKSLSERAIAALKAGNQVLLFGPKLSDLELQQVMADIETAAKTDAFLRSKIEQAYQASQRYKLQATQIGP